MTASLSLVVAVREPHGARLVRELEDDGAEIVAALAPGALAAGLREAGSALREALAEADAVVVTAGREALTPELVSACDRHGVRIVPIAARGGERRWAASFGLRDALAPDVEGWRVADAAREAFASRTDRDDGRVLAVWGTHGAPGRSTIATELAVELARERGRAGLVDADTHAPSLAAALGLAEDNPGIAAAARRAGAGALDPAELTRISAPLDSSAVEVLTGLNRPSRWPELSGERVHGVLTACRGWVDHVIVDTAASLERDEEIVSDVEGPRRNAAALAALAEADAVVAVTSADPVSIARFLRANAELRALVGAVPVYVVVNRLRGGALGIDARGQVRRTLSRYAGIDDVSFVPLDTRAVDAALLAGRPVGEASPRSQLSQAIRRLAKRVGGPSGTMAGTDERPQSRREARRAA